MKGFTLIELLVVVLIIGILAAIALPQYQKAVEKSRAVEVIQNIEVIRKNIELFLLQNGGRPSSGAVLLNEIENMGAGSLQGGEWQGNAYKTNTFEYYAYCDSNSCGMEILRDGYFYTLVVGKGTGSYGPGPFEENKWSYGCVTQTNSKGRAACKSLQSLGFDYYDGDL